MSNFIVPMSGLPSISSLNSLQNAQQSQNTQQAGVPFADLLQNAMQNVGSAGAENQGTMLDLALGSSDDLHTGAVASVKSSVAVNFASNLTSAAIRAYNELMRMQI